LGLRVPSGCLSIISRIREPLLAVGWLSSFCSVRRRQRDQLVQIIARLASEIGHAAMRLLEAAATAATG
jgi:hypothetical protein